MSQLHGSTHLLRPFAWDQVSGIHEPWCQLSGLFSFNPVHKCVLVFSSRIHSGPLPPRRLRCLTGTVIISVSWSFLPVLFCCFSVVGQMSSHRNQPLSSCPQLPCSWLTDLQRFRCFCKLVSTDLGALLSGTRLFHSICSNHCGVWNIALVCPCGPLHTLLPRQVVRESTAHLTLLEFRLWVPFINDSTCSFSHHPQLPPPTLYHVLLSEAEIITI